MKLLIEAAGGVCRSFDLNPASPQIERWDLDEPLIASELPAGGALLLDVIEHCNNPGLGAAAHFAGLGARCVPHFDDAQSPMEPEPSF